MHLAELSIVIICVAFSGVGVFSESKRRDIWWVGLGVKGVT